MSVPPRRQTPTVLVGGVPVGSAHPVVVQSMTNTDTADADATAIQVAQLAQAGSELVRITVNNDAAAQAVPVIRLCTLLGVEPRTNDLTKALVVIVEHEGRLAALGVDELLGQQQVVIKSLEQNFQKTDGVAGATILGDGRVALILDVPGLVALARDPRRAARTSPALAAVES